MIRVGSFQAVEESGRLSIRADISAPDEHGLPDHLVYTAALAGPDFVEREIRDWVVTGLLVPAMALGENLHVEGPVSDDLLPRSNAELQSLLQVLVPSLQRIAITAQAAPASRGDAAPGLVGTGFSAGIDSFATLARYGTGPSSGPLSIETLAVFDVGGNGLVGKSPVIDSYVERLDGFCRGAGLRAIFVSTNLDDFYRPLGKWGLVPFERTHTLRNMSAAQFVGRGLSDYLYSSAYAYGQLSLAPGGTMGNLDPILLPLLSTRRLRLHSACADLDRIEKTVLVAGLPEAHRALDVCVAPPRVRSGLDRPNCSVCFKCARTLVTLDALGELESFSEVFDLPRYRANRPRLMRQQIARASQGDALAAEAIELARRNGLPVPFYPAAVLEPPVALLRRIVRSARKARQRV